MPRVVIVQLDPWIVCRFRRCVPFRQCAASGVVAPAHEERVDARNRSVRRDVRIQLGDLNWETP